MIDPFRGILPLELSCIYSSVQKSADIELYIHWPHIYIKRLALSVLINLSNSTQYSTLFLTSSSVYIKRPQDLSFIT